MKRMTSCGIGLALLLGVLGLPAGAQNQAPSNSQTSSSDSLGTYAKQIRKDPNAPKKPRVFDNDNLPKDDKLSIVGSATETPTDNSSAQPEEAAPAPAGSEAKAPTETKTEAKTEANTEGKTETQTEAKTEAKTEGKTEAAEAKTEAKPEPKPPAQAAGQVAPPSPEPSSSASAATAPKTPEEEQAAKEAQWKKWGEKIGSEKEQIGLLGREIEVLQREYQLRAAAMYGDVGNRFRNQAEWDKQDAQYKQQIADKQKALDDAKQKLDDLQEDARKAGVPASVREP